MNVSIIKGRLTANPEYKKSQKGTSICTFSVAVASGYGDNQTTDFFRCIAFKGTADFVDKYFYKGQEILVTGEMHNNKYEKDGKTFDSWQITANSVEFCGNKSDKQTTPKETENTTQAEFQVIETTDGDLPF